MNTPYSKQYYYGGQTQDDRLGGDIGYLYSENLTPFEGTGHLELSRKPSLLQTTNDLCTDMISIKVDNTEYKAFISQATIFKEGQTAFWGQNLHVTYPTPEDRYIRHIFQIGNYVYWTYDGDGSEMIIGRFEADKIENSSLSAPTYGYSGFTGSLNVPGTSGLYKQLIIGNIVYLTMGDKISVLDFGTMEITNFNFWGENIVGIDYVNNRIQLCLKGGKIWSWDGVTDGPGEVWQFPDYIVGANTIGNESFIITGQYRGYGLTSPTLYKLSSDGIERLFSQTKSPTINESKFRIVFNSNQSITKIGDKIVMIDQANTGDDRLAVYGSVTPGTQRAYVVLNTRNSQGDNFTEIGFIKGYGNDLYIGWKVGGGTDEYGVDVINFDPFADYSYESSGYICTNVEDMGNKVVRKAQCQLFTRLSGVSPIYPVNLAKNINGTGYTNIATIDSLDDTGIGRQSTIGEFRDISLKVTLNGDGNGTPKLYGQILEYEEQPL